MDMSRLKWLIIFGCCLSVIECAYQLYFYFQTDTTVKQERCLNIGSDLVTGMGNYQFNYDSYCMEQNATIKNFFNADALEAADTTILGLIEELNKEPMKTPLMASIYHNTMLYWVLINSCQIIASLLLYWVAITPSAYHTKVAFYIMLPWSILVVLIFITDFIITAFAVYIYYKCMLPSTCVMWSSFLYPNPHPLEKFDQYATYGTLMFVCITTMPLKFLVIAVKHCIGSPILVIVLIIMLTEYKRPQLDTSDIEN